MEWGRTTAPRSGCWCLSAHDLEPTVTPKNALITSDARSSVTVDDHHLDEHKDNGIEGESVVTFCSRISQAVVLYTSRGQEIPHPVGKRFITYMVYMHTYTPQTLVKARNIRKEEMLPANGG